ncbi:hypothetical protein GCM10010349_24620 [Streptomyces flavofungini]|nr:hypothetical protein GCM10010349_24620 [Streptomyces flavofungini]
MSLESTYWSVIEEHQRIGKIQVPPNELHICFQFKPGSVGEFGLICRKAALYAAHAYFIVPYRVGAFSTSPEIDEHTGELRSAHASSRRRGAVAEVAIAKRAVRAQAGSPMWLPGQPVNGVRRPPREGPAAW